MATDSAPLFAPKRRGRPPTSGKALTVAERKRRQRERDAGAVVDPEAERKPSAMTLTGLLEGLAYCTRRGMPAAARALADELVRRAEAKRKT